MVRVMLVGPYGRRNLGDNLILELILAELRSLDLDVTVSCSDPAIVEELYDVAAIPLLEYRSLALNSMRQMKHMDAVIIGGGEQLSEPRIPNPVWGHLARTAHLGRLAYARGVPFMLWSVGLDDIRAAVSRFLLRKWICRQDHVICLRDSASVSRMLRLCPQLQLRVNETADPAFCVSQQDKVRARGWLHDVLGVVDDGRKLLLLVPANDNIAPLKYISELIEFGRRMALKGYRVLGWITDLQASYDVVLADLAEWQKVPEFKWLPRTLYRQEAFAKIVAAVDLIVSARMHPLIVAYTQSTPSLVLVRNSKMAAFAAACDFPQIRTDYVTVEALMQLCSDLEISSLAIASKQLVQLQSKARATVEIFRHEVLLELSGK